MSKKGQAAEKENYREWLESSARTLSSIEDLQRPSDEPQDPDYQWWFRQLPNSIKQLLANSAEEPEENPENEEEPEDLLESLRNLDANWHLVLIPEGEAPTCESFESADDLSKRLAELDGQDVFAFAFYGLIVPFSIAPWRYLFTPDSRVLEFDPRHQAVFEREATELSPEAKLQEDSYLGPTWQNEALEPEERQRLTVEKKQPAWKVPRNKKNKGKSLVVFDEESSDELEPDELG